MPTPTTAKRTNADHDGTTTNNNQQNDFANQNINLGRREEENESADDDDEYNDDDNLQDYLSQIRQEKIKMACLGNSIQYYNDCPRLLERIFWEAGFTDAKQDSCLRGGASLPSLWTKGNGMRNKFATPNALISNNNSTSEEPSYDIGAPSVQALLENDSFDFAILNDHTQSPAREESRDKTLRALEQDYAPLLLQSSIVPIFIQTAAYRIPEIRGTEDLGSSFEEFQALLEEGYEQYKQQMDVFFEQQDNNNNTNSSSLVLKAHIAPVGLAYQELYHSNPELWTRLYQTDDFHPSPHGTLLQAYVIFLTVVHALLLGDPTLNSTSTTSSRDVAPELLLASTYETSWWDHARVMQPPEDDPLPLPTQQEAEILRQVAIQVCRDSWNNHGLSDRT